MTVLIWCEHVLEYNGRYVEKRLRTGYFPLDAQQNLHKLQKHCIDCNRFAKTVTFCRCIWHDSKLLQNAPSPSDPFFPMTRRSQKRQALTRSDMNSWNLLINCSRMFSTWHCFILTILHMQQCKETVSMAQNHVARTIVLKTRTNTCFWLLSMTPQWFNR